MSARVPSPRASVDDDDGRAALAAAAADAARARGISDDQVLLAARAGDTSAIGEIYDRHVDAVYRYAYYRCADRVRAEAAVAAGFLDAVRTLDTAPIPAVSIRAWIIQHVRASMAEAYVLRVDVGAGDVAAALRKLPADQQECVVLRHVHRLPAEDVAIVLDRPPATVAALEAAALAALRGLISEAVVA